MRTMMIRLPFKPLFGRSHPKPLWCCGAKMDDRRLAHPLTLAQPPRAVHSRTTRRSVPSRAARRFRAPPRLARPAPPRSNPSRKPPIQTKTQHHKDSFQDKWQRSVRCGARRCFMIFGGKTPPLSPRRYFLGWIVRERQQ